MARGIDESVTRTGEAERSLPHRDALPSPFEAAIVKYWQTPDRGRILPLKGVHGKRTESINTYASIASVTTMATPCVYSERRRPLADAFADAM